MSISTFMVHNTTAILVNDSKINILTYIIGFGVFAIITFVYFYYTKGRLFIYLYDGWFNEDNDRGTEIDSHHSSITTVTRI